MTFVYVSNADSGDISVLSLAAGGELTPVHTLALGGSLMPLALSPCQSFLYVARRSEPMALLSLRIDPPSGRLSRLGETGLPASMAYVSTDRSGRFLFAASYPSHQITVSPIGPDGRVGAVQQTLGTGPNAHAILAAPSNRHVLVTSLGGGRLMNFEFDPASGQLSPKPAADWTARPGAGPRHFCFSPCGRFVYLLNELDAGLDVLAFDAHSGQLRALQTISSLPSGFSGQAWAADIHITPDGRHLYTSERNSSTLAIFKVQPESGLLSSLGHVPVEAQPRGFAIDASGQQLLVVGQQSHHLGRWRIDPHSGQLDLQQRLPVGQNPNWVEIRA